MDFSEISNLLNNAIRRGVPGDLRTRRSQTPRGKRRAREALESGGTSSYEDGVSLGEYAYKDVDWSLMRERGKHSSGEERSSEEEEEEPINADEEGLKGEDVPDADVINEVQAPIAVELPEDGAEPPAVEVLGESHDPATQELAASVVSEPAFQPILMDAEEFYGETLSLMLEEAQEEPASEHKEESLSESIHIDGTDIFKSQVQKVISSLPRYMYSKLVDYSLRVKESAEAKLVIPERTIYYPSPRECKSNWEFGLKVMLGVALDLALGDGVFASLRSPAMMNVMKAMRYKMEHLPYPISSPDARVVFAIGVATMLTDESALARTSKTLYDYLLNVLRIYGGR